MGRGERWLAIGGALACVGALSCGDDDAQKGVTSGGQNVAKVAMALTGGVDFENGSVVAGLLPDPDNQTVHLDEASTTLSLAPGGADILPLDVMNPDAADTPVAAVLLQFEGAKEHVEVSVDGSAMEMETFELPFTIGDDVCAGLCDALTRLKLLAAVRMSDDSVSEHIERLLQIDCRSAGDHSACEAAPSPAVEKPATGAGQPRDGGSSSSGGSSPTTLATTFAGALTGANSALCPCAGFSASPCDALVPNAAIKCIRGAVEAAAADTAVTAAINTLTSALTMATADCRSCNAAGLCPATLFADALADLPKALADEILVCAGGTLPP